MDESQTKQLNREKRGQISAEYLSKFSELSNETLIQMLKDDDPQKRTAAAKTLGKTRSSKNVASLCEAMKNEKAFYSRIAMSESLGGMGLIAVPNLIEQLGKIGNNQETELPSKYFKKKSFPLQRDLAARTLVKIGRPALPYLIHTISNHEDIVTREQAVDAVGGIAFKTNDHSAVDVIIQTIHENINTDNRVLFWKCIRALSGFKKNRSAFDVLMEILGDNNEPPILWETMRSIGKIGIFNTQLVTMLKNFETENTELKLAYDCLIIDLNLKSFKKIDSVSMNYLY